MIAWSPSLAGAVGAAGPAQDPGHRRRLRPSIVDRSVIDGVETVSNDDAFAMARKAARDEGLPSGFLGRRPGRRYRVAAREENRGKLVVAIIPSFAERYLPPPCSRG